MVQTGAITLETGEITPVTGVAMVEAMVETGGDTEGATEGATGVASWGVIGVVGGMEEVLQGP